MSIRTRMKEHLADSTALLAAVNPAYALLETQFAGMSTGVSIRAKILGAVLTYGGIGSLYSKGRDFSQRLFRITGATSERVKRAHDALYGLAFNGALSVPFYYTVGVRDSGELAKGMASSCLIGLVSGIPVGYAIDAYRDFLGIKASERLPDWLSQRDARTKRACAALATAGSVAALAAVYSLNR